MENRQVQNITLFYLPKGNAYQLPILFDTQTNERKSERAQNKNQLASYRKT